MLPALAAVRVTEVVPVTLPPREIAPAPAEVEIMETVVLPVTSAPVVMLPVEEKLTLELLEETRPEVAMLPPLAVSEMAPVLAVRPVVEMPALLVTAAEPKVPPT